MSGRYSYLRKNKDFEGVKKILNEKYDGNLFKLKDAEEDYRIICELNKCHNKVRQIKKEPIISSERSYTLIDFNQDELSYVVNQQPILSASLDSIAYRRLLPDRPSNIFLRLRQKENSKGTRNADKIFTFLQNLVMRSNFQVSSIVNDRANGIIKFNTIQSDAIHGSTRQYATIYLNKNAYVNMDELVRGELKRLLDNQMLYAFFTLYGFSKFFIRCNCREYLNNFSRKDSGANYFCNHAMWSMSVLPYYLYYSLS